jgi:alpha-D-ribose 1-methylphosphonate 5-triphosphate synthase subunit PhnL
MSCLNRGLIVVYAPNSGRVLVGDRRQVLSMRTADATRFSKLARATEGYSVSVVAAQVNLRESCC